MKRRSYKFSLYLVFSGLLFLLAACETSSPTQAPENDTPTVQPFTSTPTLRPTLTPTPSPTPEPLAAQVNGEPITLAEYQAELARFQAAQQVLPDVPLASDPRLDMQALVLEELISQRLFAQAAYGAGFSLSQEELQARLDRLKAELGGAQAWQETLAANYYTPQDFQAALARSIAAAWMRDEVLASFPTNAEQTHARHILLYNQDDADQILAQLRSGQDFTTLAFRYDPVAGGDLGWFFRGYLFEPALEEAAFQLEPGAYSQVIATQLGYHILLVIAREADRPLAPDALQVFHRQALRTWLEEQRTHASIQVFLP